MQSGVEKRKIGFSGFEGYWPGFNREQNLFTDILRERFEIEVSDCFPIRATFLLYEV